VLAANALLAPVSALVGLGVGVVLRHTAGAVVGTCALLVVVPGFFKPGVHQWANELYALFPSYAWRNCLGLRHPPHSEALPTVAGSWFAYALWAVLALLATLLVIRRRDL